MSVHLETGPGHTVALRTSCSDQVCGSWRDGCREGRSPDSCRSNHGTTNRGPLTKLNASSWLAGQGGRPSTLRPTPVSCALLPKQVLLQPLLHRSTLPFRPRPPSGGLRLVTPGSFFLWQVSL